MYSTALNPAKKRMDTYGEPVMGITFKNTRGSILSRASFSKSSLALRTPERTSQYETGGGGFVEVLTCEDTRTEHDYCVHHDPDAQPLP